MKNKICLILAMLLLVTCLLPGCNKATDTPSETTVAKDIMQKSDPAEDDTLNILMIGSSFCYYYVEELYAMLSAAGIKAQVCNVYYSGCPLEKHWTWWKNSEANYDYYVTNDRGRVSTNGVSLEYCLAQENWDVISLQEATSRIFKNGAQTHLENTQTYWQDLLNYIMDQFPQSRMLWHQPWTYQVEYGKDDVYMTAAIQEKYQKEIEDYAIGICNYFEGKIQRVNSGRAWQICRAKYGYDYLTCRQKSNYGQGDGSHDGDIGGGQYLNACVWYEVITGKSCISNPYRPAYQITTALSDELEGKLKITIDGGNYVLTEEIVSTLQNAAHEAVASTGLSVTE